MRDWKKSFQKIPPKMVSAISAIPEEAVRVFAGKRINAEKVDIGEYDHLGLTTATLRVGNKWEVVPPASIGIRSKRNVEGWETVRYDLPKYKKYYYHDIAIYGDGARNGWTTAAIPREVYERDVTPPYLFHIEVEVQEQFRDGTFGVTFAVDDVFSKTDKDFQSDVLFALNLLQENTGVSGIVGSKNAKFVFTTDLNWKVFPPGSMDEVFSELSKSRQSRGDFDPAELLERLKLFEEFEPVAWLRGLGGNDHYVGAKFADDLVAFENLKYGNALYVLYEDWDTLARKPRRELLKLSSKNFDRIIHTAGWQNVFVALITEELRARGKRIKVGRKRRR